MSDLIDETGSAEEVEEEARPLPPFPEPPPPPPPFGDAVLEHLDPSVVILPVFWDQAAHLPEPLYLWYYRGLPQRAKREFWGGQARWHRDVRQRGNWFPRNPFLSYLGDLPRVDRDYMLLSDERIEELQSLQSVNVESRKVIVPWSVNEHMEEKVPQFTLRNIARLEKDDAVERGIRLDWQPPPFAGAAEAIEEVRNYKHEKAEMPDSWSIPLFDEFAVFIEEVLSLCPWEEMPRGRSLPPEDSAWHPAHSRSPLTAELLARRGTIMVFGQHGKPKTLLTERREVVYKAKDAPAPPANKPPPPPTGDRNSGGGFGFGPDSGPMG